MSLFITDGNHRATLAVVRALGQAGIRVTVGDTEHHSIAGLSRYCASTVQYPSPVHDPAAFKHFIREEVCRNQYSVLLPMTDITVTCVAEDAAGLSMFTTVPMPALETILTVQDKAKTLAHARKLGIAVPATVASTTGDAVEQALAELKFPIVIKPRCSRVFRDGRWHYGKVDYAANADELKSKYQAAHAQIPYPLLQEKLAGEGSGVFLLVWNGELKAAFAHRRIREKPPSGGVSVCCESAKCNAHLLDTSFRLLADMGWQGPAMVEFKGDCRDGVPKLMEINGRFWGSLQLAIDAGVNFPLLLYRLATGESVSPCLDYKAGIRNRWLLGELDHLMMRLAMPPEVHRALFPLDSKASALLEFLKLYQRNVYYSDCRGNDLRPFLMECKRYARKIFSKSKASARSPRPRIEAGQIRAVAGR